MSTPPPRASAHASGTGRASAGKRGAWRTSGAHLDGKRREWRDRRGSSLRPVLPIFMPFLYPSLPVRSRLVPPRQGGGPLLPPWLLSQPIVEHGAREANVSSYSMAGQAASPHGLVHPARLDVEMPSGLLRAQESILGRRDRWACCWCLHTPFRPPSAQTAQRIYASPSSPDLTSIIGSKSRRNYRPDQTPRPQGGPPGKSLGKS
jgi:hypothetical protein